MAILSESTELELLTRIETIVSEYSNHVLEQQKKTQMALGLISRKKVCDELGITLNTIREWEKAGLKRYQPPLENGRKTFYKINDVIAFLTVK